MTSRARERSGKSGTTEKKLMAVEVNGERIVVDSAAMSIRDRQRVRAELAKLPKPDTMDSVAAAIWITLRKQDETLTFEEVCESLTVEQLEGAEFFDAEADSPEV